MVLRDLERIQGKVLGFVAQTVLELSHTAQDAGSVGFSLASLLAHAELNCEPVNGSQALKLSFTGSKRGQPDFLGKLSEILVCKHWCMTKELMDDVGLRCIQRRTVMANVLG